jgi:hypothetical protein
MNTINNQQIQDLLNLDLGSEPVIINDYIIYLCEHGYDIFHKSQSEDSDPNPVYESHLLIDVLIFLNLKLNSLKRD